MKRRLLGLTLALITAFFLMIPAWGAEEIVGNLNQAPAALAEETPWLRQSELGSVAADSFRAAADSEIAVVALGELGSDLNQGTVTRSQAEAVFSREQQLAVAEVTAAQLWALLEHAVSHVTTDPTTEQVQEEASIFDGFLQVSGFCFRYDASAPVGERVLEVTLDGGEALSADSERMLTLAAPEELFQGAYDYPALAYSSLEETLSEALCACLARNTELPQGETERITVVGARQNLIVGLFPEGSLGGGCALLAGALAVSGLRLKRLREQD